MKSGIQIFKNIKTIQDAPTNNTSMTIQDPAYHREIVKLTTFDLIDNIVKTSFVKRDMDFYNLNLKPMNCVHVVFSCFFTFGRNLYLHP